jgi:glycosyltransferase involved in cell wall biosynthesis
MNILHLHERTEIKGGAEVYISQLQQLLPAYGYKSYWLAIDNYTGDYLLSEYGVKTIEKKQKTADVLDYIKGFIRRNAINIICIHNIFDQDVIAFCLNELPVVKFAHGPVMVCPGKDKFWRYSEEACTIKYGLHCFWHIYRQGCSNRHPSRVWKAWNIVNYEVKTAAKKYRKIVVMSEFIKNGLLECGIPGESIVCNPYFTPEVKDLPAAVAGVRKKNLLFIGRLISSKGPHILIQSLIPLLKTGEDLHLDIIGDGAMKEELIGMVEKAGISDKVSFHGWLSKERINSFLQDCYLVLFPSLYPEAFGIVGIEAMMWAKPVIAFDVGGVSSWLENGGTGFLVNVGDRQSMRERAQLLLNDVSLYAQMSARARKVALERFTPAIHLGRLLEIFKSDAL